MNKENKNNIKRKKISIKRMKIIRGKKREKQ